MTKSKLGKVVWHDLLTRDESASKQFYEGVAGWRYLIEHATEFAWGGGEKDFVLALLGGEAGAGIFAQSEVRYHGWVHYVEVEDIHRSAQRALDLGGTVVKPPFDVPGVGSNCLLRDPLGAYVGIAVSKHDYPIPKAQFAPDFYQVGGETFPLDFYQQMFGWRLVSERNTAAAAASRIMFEESVVGFCAADQAASSNGPAWLPVLRIASLAEAQDQVALCNGTVLNAYTPISDAKNGVLACDATDLLFCLTDA